MQITVDEAASFFDSLPADLRYAHLHPYYIQADAHRDDALIPTFFLYKDKNDFFYHGFHLSAIPGLDYYDIQSAYGYGGILTNSHNERFLEQAWNQYCLWCKSQRVLVEFIRFHPVLSNWQWYQGEKFFDRHTIRIELEKDNLLSQYSVRARTAVRKAIKSGLVVEWCTQKEFLQSFIPIYQTAMQFVHADQFYFFSDQYFSLITNHNVKLAICKYQDEIIAGSIFLIGGDNMEYHLSAATLLGKKLNATNLILHEAALLGKCLGCKHLHLGGGTDDRADNPLLFFKKSFSSNMSEFYIGKNVFFPDVYLDYKTSWFKEHGIEDNRILFYRF